MEAAALRDARQDARDSVSCVLEVVQEVVRMDVEELVLLHVGVIAQEHVL